MSFQVVYQRADRLIIGLGPFDTGVTDLGPDYPIATLNNDALQAVIDNAVSATLATDDQSVITPEGTFS